MGGSVSSDTAKPARATEGRPTQQLAPVQFPEIRSEGEHTQRASGVILGRRCAAPGVELKIRRRRCIEANVDVPPMCTIPYLYGERRVWLTMLLREVRFFFSKRGKELIGIICHSMTESWVVTYGHVKEACREECEPDGLAKNSCDLSFL